MTIGGILAVGITIYIYKPTYSVTLDGEFLGYTKDKAGLQYRINNYMQQEAQGNIAFVQIDSMPQYDLCLLKKDIETNDDEIYNKVISQKTTYYKYFALLKDEEEKYYFSSFEEAEEVIQKLKDKNSANVDKLTVIEKYNNELAEFADVETSVSDLYEKKVIVRASTGGVGASGMNTGRGVDIGITLVKPAYGTITSRYGLRSRDNHKGLDIGASYASPIYAAASGTVVVAAYGYNGGYGNYVIISHGNGVQTLYGHCSSLCVEPGEYVSQGQLIAKVGSTGISTGNHLHFEVRVNGVTQDPQTYIY